MSANDQPGTGAQRTSHPDTDHRTRRRRALALVVAVACLAVPLAVGAAQADEPAPAPCNGLMELLGLCEPAPPPDDPAPAPAPAPAPCNGLMKLLGMCPPTPTTTTTAAPTTTSAPTSTTSIPSPDPTGDCQPVPKAGGGTWECVWADEFDGTELDRSVWNVQTTDPTEFDSNDHDCILDSPNNIKVEDGALTLTARQEPEPFICDDPKGGPRETQYTSATIQTFQKVSVHRGRVEFRAQVTSKSKGTHSALWMWPQDLLGSEIDIAEMYGTYPDRVIPYLHHPLSGLDGNDTNNFCLIDDIADWNTYTLEWTADALTVLYNGEVCISSTMAAPYYNEDFMLVISQMLGFPGNDFEPGVTPLPAHTIVDYVRVWE